MAVVTHLFRRPAARAPVVPLAAADLAVGAGLVGDHAGAGPREVTVLDLDAWNAACADLGRTLDPALRRANVVVSGLVLTGSRGRVLRLGAHARIEIHGETRPCELIEGTAAAPVAPGLARALRPDWRGGVFGRVLVAGRVAIGAAVEWDPT